MTALRRTGQLLTMTLLFAAALQGCSSAEDRKNAYLARGQEYLAQRRHDKARIEFSNALQIDPKDARARYFAGVVAERLGNPRDAVRSYQAAMELDPAHADARAALARLYLFGGLADKALELAEEGLGTAPQNGALLTVRGAARSARGDKAGAMQDAVQAAKLAPTDEYAVALLASLQQRAGDADAAAATLRRSIDAIPQSIDLRIVAAEIAMTRGRVPEAEERLRQVIGIAPDDPAHRYRLARLHVMNRDVLSAERVLRDAIERWPESAEPKLALIDMLAAQRGVKAATAELESLRARHAEDAALQVAFAGWLERNGDVPRAIAIYESIAAQGRESAGLDARNRLAALALGRGDDKRARALVAEVLAENPRDADALVMRGNLALADGDANAAITDLRAVLRDQPNSAPVLRALARAHLQKRELALAEETLRAAVQSNPTHVPSRLDLAMLLDQSGKRDQSLPMLASIVKDAPEEIPARVALVRGYMERRDLRAAREVADGLRSLRPDVPTGPYLLGLVDEAEGNRKDAARHYDEALAMPRAPVEALVARVRLDVTAKRAADALPRIEAFLARDPAAAAYNTKAEVLATLARHDEAVAAYEKALAKAPRWWLPYRGLALAHLAAGRAERARETLRRGLGQAAEPVALAADLAVLHEREGKPDQAIAVYEQLLERSPESALAVNNLAMLLVNYRSDKASLDRAVTLVDRLASSKDPAVLDTRGWVKLRAGAREEALRILQSAADGAPDSPMIRYHLAMAQLGSGDVDAARRNLQTAVAARRPFFGISDARSKLRELGGAG